MDLPEGSRESWCVGKSPLSDSVHRGLRKSQGGCEFLSSQARMARDGLKGRGGLLYSVLWAMASKPPCRQKGEKQS